METGNTDESTDAETESIESKFKITAATCVALAVLVGGIWVATGMNFVTQYKVPVTVTETDEFGDEVERTVMKEQFRFGLLPDKGYDAAAPLILGFLAIGGGALGWGWWRRKQEEQAG